jgi:cytochrome bd-type quinol oxidase subunit 2
MFPKFVNKQASEYERGKPMLTIVVFDGLIILTVVLVRKWQSLRERWRAGGLLAWYALLMLALPVTIESHRDGRLQSEFLASLLMLVAVGGVAAAVTWPHYYPRAASLGYRIVSWQASSTREERGHPVDWAYDKAAAAWRRRFPRRG